MNNIAAIFQALDGVGYSEIAERISVHLARPSVMPERGAIVAGVAAAMLMRRMSFEQRNAVLAALNKALSHFDALGDSARAAIS